MAWNVWYGMDCMVYVMVWYSLVWYGRFGMTKQDGIGLDCAKGTVWYCILGYMIWSYMVYCMAWNGIRVNEWDAMLCYAMPCHAMPCHAMLCHAMLCYAMICGVRSVVYSTWYMKCMLCDIIGDKSDIRVTTGEQETTFVTFA